MIRKLVASVLVVVLFAQCFYKLACVTYYQLNKDYIAAFLCENRDNPITVCYGQCFLKKALGFDAESKSNTLSSNQKFELPILTINCVQKEDVAPAHVSILLTEYKNSQEEFFHRSVFHPPLFAC